MHELLDMMASKDLNHSIGLNEKESELDREIKDNLDEKTLLMYLKLQDHLMSDRVECEREAYKKGFVSGIKLLNQLSKT